MRLDDFQRYGARARLRLQGLGIGDFLGKGRRQAERDHQANGEEEGLQSSHELRSPPYRGRASASAYLFSPLCGQKVARSAG